MDIQFWIQHGSDVFFGSIIIALVAGTVAVLMTYRRIRKERNAPVGWMPWFFLAISGIGVLAMGTALGIMRIIGTA